MQTGHFPATAVGGGNQKIVVARYSLISQYSLKSVYEGLWKTFSGYFNIVLLLFSIIIFPISNFSIFENVTLLLK